MYVVIAHKKMYHGTLPMYHGTFPYEGMFFLMVLIIRTTEEGSDRHTTITNINEGIIYTLQQIITLTI